MALSAVRICSRMSSGLRAIWNICRSVDGSFRACQSSGFCSASCRSCGFASIIDLAISGFSIILSIAF